MAPWLLCLCARLFHSNDEDDEGGRRACNMQHEYRDGELDDLFSLSAVDFDIALPHDHESNLPLELTNRYTAPDGRSVPILTEGQSVPHGPDVRTCGLSANSCWGGVAAGTFRNCTPGFQIGNTHFKTKFCGSCAASLTIPVSRVRACTAELAASLSVTSKMQAGFWKGSPLGDVRMRVVNNTMQCVGPWLAIYEGTPPPLAWTELPSDWLDGKGQTITFCISKGTLVPRAAAFFQSRESRARDKANRHRADNAIASGHAPATRAQGRSSSGRSVSGGAVGALPEGSSSASGQSSSSSSTCMGAAQWHRDGATSPESQAEADDSFSSKSSAAGSTSAASLVRTSSSLSCTGPSALPASLIEIQRQLASMIEHHLRQDDGSMPADQRERLEQQLQHATSLLNANR